ncbi:MAG: hypothetical protein ACJAYU_000376 [Bradymonadia bacterium]
MRNGEEVGTDCGAGCGLCDIGETCGAGSDCVDGVCAASDVCSPATCSDGVTNGNELGVDCGSACGVDDCEADCTGGSTSPASSGGGWTAELNWVGIGTTSRLRGACGGIPPTPELVVAFDVPSSSTYVATSSNPAGAGGEVYVLDGVCSTDAGLMDCQSLATGDPTVEFTANAGDRVFIVVEKVGEFGATSTVEISEL